MVDIETVRTLALGLPGAEEHDHFGRPSFRVRKRIFATLWVAERRVVVKLNLIDQSVFCDFNKDTFCPVAGAWGKSGWTTIELSKVRRDMFTDALRLSWKRVAPKKFI